MFRRLSWQVLLDKHRPQKDKNMSMPSTSPLNRAIVCYLCWRAIMSPDMIHSPVPAEFQGGWCWTKSYWCLPPVPHRLWLESKVCCFFLTFRAYLIFASSHDLQSMARIHRSVSSGLASQFDAHSTIQRWPKTAGFHIPILDSWDHWWRVYSVLHGWCLIRSVYRENLPTTGHQDRVEQLSVASSISSCVYWFCLSL